MNPQLIICKFFLSILMLLAYSKIYGQENQNPNSQLFDAKFKIEKHSLVHTASSNFTINEEYPIKIMRTNGDSIFFELKSDKKKDEAEEKLLLSVVPQNEKMYFLLSEGSDKVKFSDFDVSPLVIPLKIRPALASNPLQFTGDVSIGTYLGYQVGSRSYESATQISETTLTFCLFASPSVIKLDVTNSVGGSDSNNNLLGLTAGAGILFDLNNTQFGLVSGFDWVSGDASKTWNYQGKPWCGFTFAYHLLNK